MKYFFGEIVITHKKTWFGWVPYTDKFSLILVEAKDWLEAREKAKIWSESYMKGLISKWRYECITTAAI